jgi:hypothetical protein
VRRAARPVDTMPSSPMVQACATSVGPSPAT